MVSKSLEDGAQPAAAAATTTTVPPVKKKNASPAKSGMVQPMDFANVSSIDGLWTVKYAPRTIKDIIGNSGACKQLTEWLTDWDTGKTHAALLSGPPGIGKTTAAHIIAE